MSSPSVKSNLQCVWKKPQKNKSKTCQKKEENLSFSDLMSEDLARSLQKKEDSQVLGAAVNFDQSIDSCDDVQVNFSAADDDVKPFTADVGDDDYVLAAMLQQQQLNTATTLDVDETTAEVENDHVLAAILQQQFNREHDLQLQREEQQLNKNSKVSLSLEKYKLCHDAEFYSDEEEDSELTDDKRLLDSFEGRQKRAVTLGACGYARDATGELVTKHDKAQSECRNAVKLMKSAAIAVNVGDGGGFDMAISNNVYNNLSKSLKKDCKRKHRVHDKMEKATAEKAVDPATRMRLYKLVNNGTLEALCGTIATGKEAVVFRAKGGEVEGECLPVDVAVKVYKTALASFKTRERYLRGDTRFNKRPATGKGVVMAWAMKEFQNLVVMARHGLPVPRPLRVRHNVLLMTLVPNDDLPAPQLKDVTIAAHQWHAAFHQVKQMMRCLYSLCSLVHADLSEFNLLWGDGGKVWMIDVGQAVGLAHPEALFFLYRDCNNVITFFASRGVGELLSALALFAEVSDIAIEGPDDQAIPLIENHMRHRKVLEAKGGSSGAHADHEDVFESLWQQQQQQKEKEIQQKKEEEEQGQEEEEEAPGEANGNAS